MNKRPLIDIRWLDRQPYGSTWQMLQARAEAVVQGLDAEIIFSCEHEPVYTTGRRGVDNRRNDLLPAPVVHSDRGGEMTFHGPGQLMLYPIINLRAHTVDVKTYIYMLEQSCIDLLKSQGIEAGRRCGFPGVWTEQCKIAALGVRITHGVAYHGMALNVDVDPAWFAAINPCGLQSGIVNISCFVNPLPLPELAAMWMSCFNNLLDIQKM